MPTFSYFLVLSVVLLTAEILYIRMRYSTSVLTWPVQSHHTAPYVTTGGGFVVYLAILSFLICQTFSFDNWNELLLSVTVLATVSYVDDRTPLSPILRLAVQVIVIGFAFSGWPRPTPFTSICWCSS